VDRMPSIFVLDWLQRIGEVASSGAVYGSSKLFWTVQSLTEEGPPTTEFIDQVPPLPDPHVTEQDVLKCTRVVLAFMYSYGDWEGLINGEALLSFGPPGSRRLCEALM
ncbi:hypothetical protein FOZ62_014267, partial [Perkinsus olseni]